MDRQAPQILIVEDDERTAAFLADNLRADGFVTAVAAGAGEAVRRLEVTKPVLVLLDLALEGGSSGLEVLDRIRSADGLGSRIDPGLPVIVLTGRSGEQDRVRGLSRGADDYVVKPFFYAELIARVRAVLRRVEARSGEGVLHVGELTVDPEDRIVRLRGKVVELSAKEFALLHALARRPTRVYPKAELLRDVWGYLSIGTSRTVDAHACRLRRKLGGRYVLSVRGVGYRLVEAV